MKWLVDLLIDFFSLQLMQTMLLQTPGTLDLALVMMKRLVDLLIDFFSPVDADGASANTGYTGSSPGDDEAEEQATAGPQGNSITESQRARVAVQALNNSETVSRQRSPGNSPPGQQRASASASGSSQQQQPAEAGEDEEEERELSLCFVG